MQANRFPKSYDGLRKSVASTVSRMKIVNKSTFLFPELGVTKKLYYGTIYNNLKTV